MLYEYCLYEEQVMSRQKSKNMLKAEEVERMIRVTSSLNKKKREKAVITSILAGAGNVLVSTGNKLLDIA